MRPNAAPARSRVGIHILVCVTPDGEVLSSFPLPVPVYTSTTITATLDLSIPKGLAFG